MRKSNFLNSEITKVLADLGHTDTVVIADCGLPIPEHVKKIDLSLTLGIPDIETVLKAVLKEMEVESVTVAKEADAQNQAFSHLVNEQFDSIEKVSHEKFKQQTSSARAVIRTGEHTPYANIILHAGVIF
ncbi:D-ribose pyranase [Jeotgalibacillus haloalkalitolerans]|uniref:D-ribose pyranase n=1 Tax=Jeotgalibacillus haloalkalitolerans TaxID=3104292 RepID=A0ABU5KIK4_9BACL|nr:D-ribose pyranase [Jeotgalibacillus sp. HH7-29]MDZ5710756.1 D-ribose pyranase [Jeotgalibacillus sp. HH7-29]